MYIHLSSRLKLHWRRTEVRDTWSWPRLYRFIIVYSVMITIPITDMCIKIFWWTLCGWSISRREIVSVVRVRSSIVTTIIKTKYCLYHFLFHLLWCMCTIYTFKCTVVFFVSTVVVLRFLALIPFDKFVFSVVNFSQISRHRKIYWFFISSNTHNICSQINQTVN